MASSSSSNDMEQQMRSKENTSEGFDYISHLPEAIMLYILSFLPIKDLMVVSLLSRLWKSMVVNHLFIAPSSLKLDEFESIKNYIRQSARLHQCAEFHVLLSSPVYLKHLHDVGRRQYQDYVDRTLMLHTGCTINKLQLILCYDGSDGYTRRITRWVRFAFTNKIKKLILDFSRGQQVHPDNVVEPYDLSVTNFSPVNLQSLTLTYCKLTASSFGILWSVKRLCLKMVTIVECSISDLVTKCPVLEDLSMEHCVFPNKFMVSETVIKIKRLLLIHCTTEDQPMFSIEMSAPELLELEIVANYLMVSSIRNAVNLLDVEIDVDQDYADHIQGDALSSFLNGLDHCKTLTLTTWCIQLLPIGENLLNQLPKPLQRLEHSKLVLGFGRQELPGIACLLRSCPNLKSLTITMKDEEVDVDWTKFLDNIPDLLNFDEETYWESQLLPFYCLEKTLKQVNISGFSTKLNEVKMVTFLLEGAKLLENMVIFCAETSMIPSNPTEKHVQDLWYQDNCHFVHSLPKVAVEARVAVFRNLGCDM